MISTMCFSIKGFKCVIEKLEGPKKMAKILQNQKNSSKLANTGK